MSDEPLYCTYCGIEIGSSHEDGCAELGDEATPRARREALAKRNYCAVCGAATNACDCGGC